MSSTVETELDSRSTLPKAPPWHGLRAAAATVGGALVFFGIVLLAYELAAARVPQHRAALERLVRSQTGLDIRFDEMGLRWGWYGPEVVFRRVELGEPGRSTVLLRAPQLVAGFDVWQTLRSGQLQAGRITLVAADIDFTRGAESVARAGVSDGSARTASEAARRGTAAARGAPVKPADAATADMVRIAEGWQGGRVDLEGGTLRLPDPGGGASNPLTLQIRRASLRRGSLRRASLGRASSEWSGYGLVFLPERLGRTARLVMRLDGDLEHPAALSGSVRFEGRRLAFAGWRELLAAVPDARRYLPRAGGGDVAFDVDFAGGRLVKASGKVSSGGLELAAADDRPQKPINLDHLKGEWQLARREFGWRLQVDSLDFGNSAGAMLTTFNLDAASSGQWARGRLEHAPLQAIATVARWFAPQLDLSAAGLEGTAHNLTFDWNRARPEGERLRTAARLTDVVVAPPSHDFKLAGLAGQLSGNETELVTELQAKAARLELARSPQDSLDEVKVDALLQVKRDANSWRITTERLELAHDNTRLKIDGSLAGRGADDTPEIDAHAELTGVDVPLLERLAGGSLAQAFGPTFSQLTAGGIERVGVELGGPFDWHAFRFNASIDGARLQAVSGIPPMDDLRGSLVFEGGSLRRSTLTGAWLGGPVTLSIGERRDHGALVLAIQARGVLDARQLALVATAGTKIDESRAPSGKSPWSGELTYLAASDTRPAQWRVRADSSLIGVLSQLPRPLAKAANAAVPLHLEAQGNANTAELRFNLGDRLHSLLALERRDAATWRVERGNVQFGPALAALPDTPVVLVEGAVSELDLPAYVVAWQQLRSEPGAPAIRADLTASELLVAGNSYSAVRVIAERTDAGADLHLQSPQIVGTAHWPANTDAAHPASFHFARLNVPDDGAFGASAELIAALGPATEFSVDDIIWKGHSIGSAAATIQSGGNVVDVTDLRLTGDTQQVRGTLHCRSAACRLQFNLDSHNAGATLQDFGFRPDLTASRATLDADLQWQVGSDRPALATLAGRLNMHLEDGITRAQHDPDGDAEEGAPFALLLVPALVSGMGQPASEPQGLRFARLEADFDLRDGEAATSNLHFDGDAEILMRGKTRLVARDYDQQVWILRGEGRLPAAVRRLGPTPRVAAAWLSLRELFASGARQEVPLHLQGSWDDPIVEAQ